MNEFVLSPDAHHVLGIELNNQTWALLMNDERDEKECRRMEHFVLGSLHHWQRTAHFKPLNAQRGHYLISRVYAALGRARECLEHAVICMQLTEQLELQDFDLAYACEAIARAHAVAGHFEQASAHHRQATQAGERIADDKDREIFIGDMAAAPWNGLDV